MDEFNFLKENKSVLWINEKKGKSNYVNENFEEKDLLDAEKRLEKFAPLIKQLFPETAINDGLIESKLTKIPNMERNIKKNSEFIGNLYIKEDNNLPIAGSVKARGGIYEVLKYAEYIAIQEEILEKDDSYEKLNNDNVRKIFSKYKIQVGSTGNLGLSIGIISAKLGFTVIVHMSKDAKNWKKDLLKQKGVIVKEYSGNYEKAVTEGRKLSKEDPTSYFIDDENSKDLFLGYTVASKRLKKQLDEQNIIVDNAHPLFIYIPCGVGGAPGGISYGLKKIYKDNVHIFFVEPIESPCMLLSIYSEKYENISVQDIGLSGKTEADGLAVGRASGLVSHLMKPILSGVFTVEDNTLNKYMKEFWNTEKMFLEQSACSSFEGPYKLYNSREGKKYLENNKLLKYMDNSTHIVWGTGGNLVPNIIRKEILEKQYD